MGHRILPNTIVIRSRPLITIAGVAQRQSSALIRRRSVVQVNPPAPTFAASRLRLASNCDEGCPPRLQRRRANPAVVQWPERLIVAQEADGSTPSPGTS